MLRCSPGSIRLGRMLCFCGADGAGKTALARLYAGWLKLHGCRVRVVGLRGTHTVASVLARFLSWFQVFRGPCNPYYGICIPSRLRRLWVWVEFFSILPVLFARFLVPRALGYLVVGERGLIDFLVWLIVTLRDLGVVRSVVGRFILCLARQVCFNVYIRARLNVLYARRRGFPEEPLLPMQLAVYDVVTRAYGLPVIDTSFKDSLGSFKQLLKTVSPG